MNLGWTWGDLQILRRRGQNISVQTAQPLRQRASSAEYTVESRSCEDKYDISVVTPTRNAQSLGGVIKSLSVQEISRIELIVVDDASCHPLPIAGADRTIIRMNAWSGVAKCRNVGAAEAKGKWVAFLDDDDVWISSRLEKMLDVAKATGCVWLYTSYLVRDFNDSNNEAVLPRGRPVSELTDLLGKCEIGCSTVLIRRKLLVDHPFEHKLYRRSDYELWLRLMRFGFSPFFVDIPNSVLVFKTGQRLSSPKLRLIYWEFRAIRLGAQIGRLRTLYFVVKHIISGLQLMYQKWSGGK